MLNVKHAITDEEKNLAYTLRKKVFVEEQGVPEHLELDAYDETAAHFIVQEGGVTIAAARVRELSPGIAKVERVCVLKEQRGRRLGVLIMQHLEKYAGEMGWKKIKLNAQAYAVPFYEKLGYVVTSPEFLDAYIPHRAMEKDI